MQNKSNNSQGFRDEFNLREMIQPYISNWKWFVVTFVVSVLVAFTVLRYTPVNFESKTRLLIKYEKAGTYSELSAFNDLGLFEGYSGYNNLYNEKEIISSRPLIEKVVIDLNLNIQYLLIGTKTGIERREFYKSSPVKLNILEGDSAKIKVREAIDIEILGESQYRIIASESFNEAKHKFGDTIKTDFGKISIDITDYYLAKNQNIRVKIYISPIEATVNHFQSKLKIEPINENVDILELSIRGPVIRKNNDFLNALVQVHTDQTIEDQLKIYKSTTEFINERVNNIAEELSIVEGDGEKYKTEYDFSDIFLSEKSLYDRTLLNEKKLVDAEIQLKLTKLLSSFLTNQENNDKLLPSNLGLEDISINDAVAQYNTIALEKMRAEAHSSSINPTVIKLENELKSIKLSLKSSLENLISTLSIRVADLRSKESGFNSEISTLPKHKRVLRSIERQQQVKESLYIYLLQKREENEIASAVTEGNSKLIESAYSNRLPVTPNKKMYYSAALFFSILVPFSFIYITRILNNKVNNKDDLDKFNLPHLASIPLSFDNSKIVIGKSNNSSIAEAFRILRTNSTFLLGPKVSNQGKLAVITSTIAAEGKSFITLNLATSFALSGKKTIIVGLDLRAPRLLKYMNLSPSKGVSDYLMDPQSDLNKYIRPLEHAENLFIMPSGTTPPNPSEMLMRDDLGEMFAELKSSFDIIIVDTAPTGLVTDTLLISKYADAFIYVVRAHFLEKKALESPQSLIDDGKIKNVGFVLNALDHSKTGGYGYNYGYSYGYDPIRNQKKKWYSRFIKNK